jgi:hypothetical protein
MASATVVPGSTVWGTGDTLDVPIDILVKCQSGRLWFHTFRIKHIRLFPVIPTGQYDSSFPFLLSRRLVSRILAQEAW